MAQDGRPVYTGTEGQGSTWLYLVPEGLGTELWSSQSKACPCSQEASSGGLGETCQRGCGSVAGHSLTLDIRDL